MEQFVENISEDFESLDTTIFVENWLPSRVFNTRFMSLNDTRLYES